MIFDNEFSLSGSEVCEEEGEDSYYRGEASLIKESVEDFGSKSVSCFRLLSDKSEGNSERATGDNF